LTREPCGKKPSDIALSAKIKKPQCIPARQVGDDIHDARRVVSLASKTKRVATKNSKKLAMCKASR
jgi:hypothetical protein